MTARSGDALSHVYFDLRQNAVFDGDQRARILRLNFAPRHRGAIRARLPQKRKSFLSYLHGGHEAASRNEPGQFASFGHYLPKSFHTGR
jgi:hypothetical protein